MNSKEVKPVIHKFIKTLTTKEAVGLARALLAGIDSIEFTIEERDLGSSFELLLSEARFFRKNNEESS